MPLGHPSVSVYTDGAEQKRQLFLICTVHTSFPNSNGLWHFVSVKYLCCANKQSRALTDILTPQSRPSLV